MKSKPAAPLQQPVPIPELNHQILLQPETGQLYLAGAVLQLHFGLIVIRHGQTDGNLRHVLHGQVDGPENQLNRKGRQQGRTTATRLLRELEARFGLEKLCRMAASGHLLVLTSPISRARHTADYFVRLFAKQTGMTIDPVIEPGLKEIHFGKYDGCALDEISNPEFRRLVITYRSIQNATIDWQGTGESFLDVLKRAKALLEKLNRTCADRLVLAFSHGTFLSALRAVLGDASVTRKDGMIAFRENVLEHAHPLWLGDFDRLSR